MIFVRCVNLLIACYTGLKYKDNTKLEKRHSKSTFVIFYSLHQLLLLNVMRYQSSKTLGHAWGFTIASFIISIVCYAITDLFVDYELDDMEHKSFTNLIATLVYGKARDRQKREPKELQEEKADVQQPLV